jgi:hypothetical protein
MDRLSTYAPEIAAGLAGMALLGAAVYWFSHRKRPTPDEIEFTRRKLLAQEGRIVDGMLEEVREIDTADGRRLTMLFFAYRIGGVDYECSQDITALRGRVEISQIRAGFPCSVRYQPGHPQNSIVAAEDWMGIRMGLPAASSFEGIASIGVSPIRTKTQSSQAQS